MLCLIYFLCLKCAFRDNIQWNITPQSTQYIAILGHIILKKDILHDIVMEVYGTGGIEVLEDRLNYFNHEATGIAGLE